YWTNFFELLEEYTISEIYYTMFDMDVSGQLQLSATATDYDAVADQLYIFNAFPQYFEQIVIYPMAIAENDDGVINGVKLSFSLNINPEIFYKAQ
ncbi:hypothetical protein ACFL23_03430, partial [Patescibacteria group bacterium]